MSQNDFQRKVNQLSLVMTIDSDIIKLCKKMDFPPDMTELLLRFHNQQVELEKSVNSLRDIMTKMAMAIEQHAETSTNIHHTLMHMGDQLGYRPEEMVSTEKVIKDE